MTKALCPVTHLVCQMVGFCLLALLFVIVPDSAAAEETAIPEYLSLDINLGYEAFQSEPSLNTVKANLLLVENPTFNSIAKCCVGGATMYLSIIEATNLRGASFSINDADLSSLVEGLNYVAEREGVQSFGPGAPQWLEFKKRGYGVAEKLSHFKKYGDTYTRSQVNEFHSWLQDALAIAPLNLTPARLEYVTNHRRESMAIAIGVVSTHFPDVGASELISYATFFLSNVWRDLQTIDDLYQREWVRFNPTNVRKVKVHVGHPSISALAVVEV